MIAALLLSMLVAERPYLGPEAVETPAARGAPIDVKEPRGRLGAVVWAPDGRSLWVAAGSTLYRLEADSGAVIGRIAVPGGDEVDALVSSPSGAHLAATTYSDHVTVWNSATGKVTLRAQRARWMLDGLVAFSPDGKRVFAAQYSEDPRGDEEIRIEAWDVASGRSLGKKRVREVPPSSDSALEFLPLQLAGSHVYFDDLLLLARPRPVQACDDLLPETTVGDLGWYRGAGVRSLDDCKVVRADTVALLQAAPAEVMLSARGERAAFMHLKGGNVAIGAIDLVADKEVGRLEYGDISRTPGFAMTPDGSQVAVTLYHSEPDGGLRQFLLLWRPFAPAEPRLLALLIPP